MFSVLGLFFFYLDPPCSFCFVILLRLPLRGGNATPKPEKLGPWQLIHFLDTAFAFCINNSLQ